MNLARRLAPFGLIVGLALGYFASLVAHPSRTLYAEHSDLIALHVPWETFLGRSWRADGERPLWNPLQFSGLPFAHDIQAAIFYPPHLIFRAVGESGVGPALSWLVVAHVVVAGWGMYAYGRSTGLGITASIVGAVGLMFAGKWLLHLALAGHYAFAALAWLPWIALGLDRSIRLRRPIDAAWAGVALGLMAMASHPQIPLYAEIFLAPWTLLFAIHADVSSVDERNRREIGVHWIIAGLVAGSIGFGIAAVQLLPSLEAVPLSTRGIAGVPESPSLSLRTLLRTFGPSPHGVRPVISWEPRSGFGVVWVAVALLSPLVATGRTRFRARWGLLLTAGLVAFALGGSLVFQAIPLFRMFRQPSRMFLIAAMPLAYLAALAVDAMLAPSDRRETARARRVVAWTAAVFVTILAVSALTPKQGPIIPHPYWFSLIVTVPAAWWLVGRRDSGSASMAVRVAWVAILGIDLVAQTWPHVQTRPIGEVLAPSAIARAVSDRAGPFDRVLDRSLPAHQSSTPLGPAVATDLGLNQIRGYNALDIARYKDYIALVADPVRVPQPYNGLTNVPIRHETLLGLLGVRWLAQPTDPALRPADAPPIDDWPTVATDPAPAAFTFALGGVRTLPPYELRENPDAFPRAFVAPEVARLPESREAIARVLASADLRRVAFVEDGPETLAGQGAPRPAAIRSYRPNRIAIDAEGPGMLVLADPWYPGWVARVDGQPTPIRRVDSLFRGVPLAPGPHSVTFRFEPGSVKNGGRLTIATAILVAAWTLSRPRKRPVDETNVPSQRFTP